MQVYLVGGAVRDKLLGLPVKERDWVVVGGSREALLKKGYSQVGKDFPVFLHPKTKEEYALARTERKKGSGYYGFDCDFSASVTLEEDLQRRDLTINAIAEDEHGVLIDPFNGQRDLKLKILRHVSKAFVEDPVRVLRLARFAARYHHLGFQIASETKVLIYEMVKLGELNHLVPERVWQEFHASLNEKNPEVFIQVLRDTGALAIIFPEIDALFGVPNPPKHHPEIDSGIHTLLSLRAASVITTNASIRFAALVHDLGKALTPMNEWPRHLKHEESGLKPIKAMCDRLRVPAEFKELALLGARFHLLIHDLLALKPKTIVKVLEQTDAFRRPERFYDLLKVARSDKEGRSKVIEYRQYRQENLWQEVLTHCFQITAQQMIEKGHQGVKIKEALNEARMKEIKILIQGWKNDKQQ